LAGSRDRRGLYHSGRLTVGGFFGGGGASASNMVGATSSAAGTAGLVPAPAAGEQNAVLSGDALFKNTYTQIKITSADSSRYYAPSVYMAGNVGTFTSNLTTQAYITLPLFLPDMAVGNLRLRHNGNAGMDATVYVALYDSDSNGLPSKPVITTSHTVTTTQGAITKTMAISPAINIKAGIYYGAFYTSLVGSLNMIAQGRAEANLWGTRSGDNPGSRAGYQCAYFANSKTGGTWEDPAPAIQFTNANSAWCFYLEVGL
jgi:hypothetical protein